VPLLLLFAASVFGQTWQIQKNDLATILSGVSFPNTTLGYLAGDMNGVGAVILKTEDGGNTYRRCNHSGYALMYLSIAFDSVTRGVVTGVGLGTNFPGIEETNDGENFVWTDTQEFVDSCQNVEVVGPASGSIVSPGFGLAGDFNQFNGASVTLDQGETWKNYDIGVDYWSRYGSYPSPTTWYISAGWWPDYDFHNPEDSNIHVLSQKIRLNRGSGVEYLHNAKKTQTSRRLLQAGYAASVIKTSDGGQTWTKVYEDLGNFYTNAIDCPTANECWVVGESESDSPQPGVRILHTGDGGNTWEVQMYNSTSTYSLMDISMLNTTEGWATGGMLSEREFEGHFWHTVDGGKSWSLQQVQGVYGNALSLAFNEDDTYVGWATAFTRSGQSSTLIYK